MSSDRSRAHGGKPPVHPKTILFASTSILLSISTSANAFDEGQVLQRLDALEKENYELRQKVARLEASAPASSRDVNARHKATSAAMRVDAPKSVGRGFAGPYAGASIDTFSSFSPGAISTGQSFRGLGGGLLAGFNVVSDPLLLGLELRAHDALTKSDENTSYSTYNLTIPSWTAGGSCSFTPCPPNTSLTSALLSTVNGQYASVRQNFGGDVSIRPGFTIDDWLLFGRLGLGAQHFDATTTNYQSTTTCVEPVTSLSSDAHSWSESIIGCNKTQTQTSSSTSSGQDFLPYLAVGFGFERNFDKYFVRGEFGMNYIMYTRSDVGILTNFGEAQGTLSAGVRF